MQNDDIEIWKVKSEALQKELALKNHELSIEASLEKVRAVAMSMREGNDLLRICEVMFNELQELSFGELRNAMIDIHYDEKKYLLNYDYSASAGKTVTRFFYGSHPIVDNLIHHAKQSKEVFTEMTYSGKALAEWRAFRQANGEEDDARFNTVDAVYYYFYSIGSGAIGISTFIKITEAQLNILKRFRNVFDLAYQRYVDITNAEAQAKEAKIEAALEKVRSRSLAMHHSKELSEVVTVVFEKLKELNFLVNDGAAIILTFTEDSKDHIEWIADPTQSYSMSFRVPYSHHSMSSDLVTARESGTEFFSRIYPFEKKNAYFNFLFQDTDYRHLSDDTKKVILESEHIGFSVAFQKHSAILVPTNFGKLLSDEQKEILKRFTKVFEQSYTRFIDLQKAEAQTRESQIQLALERVRARTMAMQCSDELADVSELLFKQVSELGIQTWATGFNIWSDDNNSYEDWITSPRGGFIDPYIVDATEFPPFVELSEARKKGEQFYIQYLDGEVLKQTYQQLLKFGDKQQFEISPGEEFQFPSKQYLHIVFGSKVSLMFITYEPVPEAYDIFKRFGKTFEQTYTRFLDLQKAEAQAKEAQIEAALERVRSRTLAMQKSDELAETVAVLFQQLIHLGIEPHRLYISIIKDEGNSEFWITDEDGSKVSMVYEDNLNNNPSFKKMYDGWKRQAKSLVIDMKGEELQEYLTYLGSIHVPFKGGVTQKRRVQYIAYFSKGFIGMASPDEQPAETLQLIERFAYVFNLTFTRFNDLQVAEAHALQAEQDLIEIKAARKKAEDTLSELQVTQRQLIQSEKMASLGELTAGIAHEIQNPLNFVNNFSEVSKELLDDMKAALESGDKKEAEDIANDIIQNLEKINHHGKRADAIVKGMLQHSRQTKGIKEQTDINALCDEYLRLSYHGLRAKDKSFNAHFTTDFDDSIGRINVVPQDVGRALLNLFNNAFYAVNERRKMMSEDYQPLVSVSTKKATNDVEITIADNGNGVPPNIIDKIFQPFFTTKPTGEGTGLGLSLTYDIIKSQKGNIKVETKEGEGSQFVIQLPIA